VFHHRDVDQTEEGDRQGEYRNGPDCFLEVASARMRATVKMKRTAINPATTESSKGTPCGQADRCSDKILLENRNTGKIRQQNAQD